MKQTLRVEVDKIPSQVLESGEKDGQAASMAELPAVSSTGSGHTSSNGAASDFVTTSDASQLGSDSVAPTFSDMPSEEYTTEPGECSSGGMVLSSLDVD